MLTSVRGLGLASNSIAVSVKIVDVISSDIDGTRNVRRTVAAAPSAVDISVYRNTRT